MSDKDFLTKTMKETLLTRRSFLKWSAALGGAAALAGGVSYGLKAAEKASAQPEGKWITAACWHNCSAPESRCLLKAYVEDGVPKRVKSDDESPDDPNTPQLRACPRGRSLIGYVLGEDRLKYPMKRKHWAPGGGDKELRGRDEWVRISWDEAYDIFASETKRIIEKYGNESILRLSHGPQGNEGTLLWDPISRIFNSIGGCSSTWGAISLGSWVFPELFMTGTLMATSDRMSLRHAKLIVCFGWGGNKNGNWSYALQQAKEAGARVIVIDPWFNQGAEGLADHWIPVRPGTDTTLMLAVAYEMIVNDLQDQDFLDKYTVGFDSEHMPEGADPKENFKDYVLGTYDAVPKTPEWASQICGTAPSEIRQLAMEMATVKPASIFAGWSTSKFPAGEQWPQVFYTVGWMTGNVGLPGAVVSYTFPDAPYATPLVIAGARGYVVPTNPLGYPIIGALAADIREQGWSALEWNEAWDDILAGEYGRDVWPGGKRKINIQMIYHGHANFLNQMPGVNKGIEVHRQVEFVVAANPHFTTSAKYADLVLPINTTWERQGEVIGVPRESVIWWQKVMEPLFESKSDLEVAVGLAERFGLDPVELESVSYKQKEYNTLAGAAVIKDDGSGYEPLVTITADDIKAMDVEGTPQKGVISLKEFKERGVYKVPRKPDDKFMYVLFDAFRQDPISNPVATASGKLEIYCSTLAQMVNMYGFSTIYPIGKWQHANPEFGVLAAQQNKEYPLVLWTPHSLRRAHSVFDSVPKLREAFGQECFMSIVDAEARGIKTGDVVLMKSQYGKVLRRAKVIPGIVPGAVALQDGAWVEIDEETGIDKAGDPNTLQHFPCSGHGVQTWTGTTLLQVEKYSGPLELLPDAQWPARSIKFVEG